MTWTLRLWRWLWCIALDWLPLESRLFRWIYARYMAAIVGAKTRLPPVKRFSDEFMDDLMADVIFAMALLGIGGVVWAMLNPEAVAGRLGAAVKAFLEVAR